MTPFPIDMIGAGERVGNTTPPSIALLSNLVASLTVRSRLEDHGWPYRLRPAQDPLRQADLSAACDQLRDEPHQQAEQHPGGGG